MQQRNRGKMREVVSLNIYDTWGRRIKTVVEARKNQGDYFANWDGTDGDFRDVSSGIYFYVLTTSDGIKITRKMLLIK